MSATSFFTVSPYYISDYPVFTNLPSLVLLIFNVFLLNYMFLLTTLKILRNEGTQKLTNTLNDLKYI